MNGLRYRLCPICCEYELLEPPADWDGGPIIIKCYDTCIHRHLPVPPYLLELIEPRSIAHTGDRYRVDLRRKR